MELTNDIRNRLRAAMEAKNETGYTINAKTGISATTVGNYINKNSKVKKADNLKLQVICNLLEIDMTWLETGHTNLVKSPVETLPKVCTTEETSEDILKQIFLKMSSRDDQFGFIHKEMHALREDVMKRMDKVEEGLANLTEEFQKQKKE